MINTNNAVVMTGWHTLCSGYELKEGFYGKDCAPLDASEHIPAGSSFKGEHSEVVLSTSTRRGVVTISNPENYLETKSV